MENLGVDYKLLIAQLINFGIFFFIFTKYAAHPLIKIMDKEKQQEKEKERIMKDLESKNEHMKEEERVWRVKLQKERDSIIAETKQAAEDIRKDMLEKATQEATEVIAKAHKQIAEEKDQLHKDVRERTVDLSMYIITNALGEYLTSDLQKQLTGHIINNLGKSISKYEN
ncbi:hypothetical protein HGB07_02295 [Candidatus Roizmanbacteria bacterium]|nr:hypothetical protein [Candidatus Roizmanbacteria bacterium]